MLIDNCVKKYLWDHKCNNITNIAEKKFNLQNFSFHKQVLKGLSFDKITEMQYNPLKYCFTYKSNKYISHSVTKKIDT